jgi:endonuclease YncB( thermonuclease family)
VTKRLLPPGTLVRLTREPATDTVDGYGRLLRYVTRVRDGINVNVRLVAVGAAASRCAGASGQRKFVIAVRPRTTATPVALPTPVR